MRPERATGRIGAARRARPRSHPRVPAPTARSRRRRHHQQPHRLPGHGGGPREGRDRPHREGRCLPLSLSTDLTTGPGAKPLPLSLQGVLSLDLDQQRYTFRDFKLKGSVQPPGAPKAIDWQFATPAADLDLAAQTLAKTSFTADVGEASLKGEITGRKLLAVPELTGSFALARLAPRKLMQQFGMVSPVTARQQRARQLLRAGCVCMARWHREAHRPCVGTR